MLLYITINEPNQPVTYSFKLDTYSVYSCWEFHHAISRLTIRINHTIHAKLYAKRQLTPKHSVSLTTISHPESYKHKHSVDLRMPTPARPSCIFAMDTSLYSLQYSIAHIHVGVKYFERRKNTQRIKFSTLYYETK